MRSPRLIERTAAVLLLLAVDSATAFQAEQQAAPHEGCVPVADACLYVREVGQGLAVVVIHGGPDFDHNYLLPEFDRLAIFHLVYYDQRGRDRSADHVRPDEVTMSSEIEDLDTIRQHFRFDAPALLGHPWGAVIAAEYALRHPERVSRLILMNPKAADPQCSHAGYLRRS